MKANILGRGIIGMPAADEVKINKMTVTMTVAGNKMVEEVAEVTGNMSHNSHHLNLLTVSGRKVILRPETRREVEEACEAFAAPEAKLQMLMTCY